MTRLMRAPHRLLAAALAGLLGVAGAAFGDDKDLLKLGSANPNVMVILSNTCTMQYLPYVQGMAPSLSPDGQYQDSPISKFGIAKGALRSVVQQNTGRFNFGISWYSYHQEAVSHKYWSYKSTGNQTIPSAAYDFPGDAFQSVVGSQVEVGTSGGGPILSAGASSCGTPSSVACGFGPTAIAGGSTLWMASALKVTGLPSSKATVFVNNAVVTFTAGSTNYQVTVPDASIVFDPAATAATTTWDSGSQRWTTTVPSTITGNVFLSGVGFSVPAAGLPGGISPVTWSAQFSSDTSDLSLNWQWAGSVYSSFTADPSAIGVKPVDNSSLSQYKNSDPAGTPENFKGFLIGGAGGTCNVACPSTPGFPNLGAAAGYAVFAMKGSGVNSQTANFSNVTVTGSVAVAAKATLQLQAPSTINGNLYVDSGGSWSGAGKVNGTVFTNQNLAQARTDAINASTAAAALTPKWTYGNVNSSLTLNGVSGLNVVKITGNIDLNNESVTLSGPSDAFFVINLAGSLTLQGNGGIVVGGAVPVTQLLINMTGSGNLINTKVGNIIQGTLLGPNAGGGTLDGSFGSLILGQNFTLASSAIVTFQGCSGPRPATVVPAQCSTCGGAYESFGVPGTTLSGSWFGDQPAGPTGTCQSTTCVGYAFENIDATHRVAAHLVPVNGGQPYGQLTMTMVKEYQTGSPSGTPTTWTTGATPAGNPGTVSLTYSANISQSPSFPNQFTTGDDNGLYMGFMKIGDWALNSDCGGWFVQNSLPAVGIPRDYNSNLSCAATTCTQPPEQSAGCVLRYTRPMSSVIHYTPGADGAYTPSNPPDDNPSLCSPSVVHTGTGPEDQIVLMSYNDNHIPEDKMFANADAYFSTMDCFANGVRSDDPNKACRTGAVILLSDTFTACGPTCSQTATSKYLVSLKSHHIPVYVIALGVPNGTDPSTEAHCIAQTSGAEDATHQGVFPITSTDPTQVASDLVDALNAILSRVDEASQDFASATISSVQAGTGQSVYLTTFNARKSRSIWDGALRGYKLLNNGAINPAPVPPATHSKNLDGSDCVTTVRDPNDPLNNVVLDVPCNQFPTLQWNTQINLAAVPPASGNPSGVADLAAGATLARGVTYSDTSNDTPHDIPIFNFPGRRILWSLPSTVAGQSTLPSTLPINGKTAAGSEPVPETTEPFLVSTGASYWPFLKLLMTQQTSPPAAGGQTGCSSPPCLLSDTSASQSVRFIRGDRDSVINELRASLGQSPFPTGDAHYYASPSGALKLGDIFHSNPQLIAEPENVFYYASNLHDYQSFFAKHKHRRRVLFTGANDGLLHAIDVGVWNRDTSVCTGGLSDCYDFGTGAELFAYAPRSVMQIFRALKASVGVQTKSDEWTVDGAPSAADMFIDVNHGGTPSAGNRAWHSILVGTMREGSALEGQTSCPASVITTAFQNSASSVYALDVTQPEPSDGEGNETTGSYAAPGCLDGGTNCPSAWPKVLWEIQDATDADGNGYPDMGESWSKPGMGRICVARDASGNCTDERYVAIFGGGFDRERKNRRGNWLYIVDVETGFVLYKVKSGTANFGSGNVTVNFASIPSEPSAIDVNTDGVLDYVYFGDLLGQMWRLDLRAIRIGGAAPTDRWSSKLVKGDGTALSAMLVFQAPQPVGGSTQFYPIYYRPTVVFMDLASSGQPVLGIAFGTGDRDDITALCDPATRSTAYNQRYYFVVDTANTQTVTEATAGMLRIGTSSASNSATNPTAGWYLLLGTSSATQGERVITDSLAVTKYIYFFTQTPAGGTAAGTCSPSTCNAVGGLVRKYMVYYANGNYAPVASDRATTVPNSSFATNPISGSAADGSFKVWFTSNYGNFNTNDAAEPTRAKVKDWKEN